MGSVLECAALRKRAIDSVPTLEAMAIFDGLKLAVNRGADHIVVESDAETVINCIKHGAPSCSVLVILLMVSWILQRVSPAALLLFKID